MIRVITGASTVILATLTHYFKLGLKIMEATAEKLFNYFKGGDLSFEIKSRSG